MQLLDIKQDERILIVAPHPDDECIGAGGVLLRYTQNCNVLIMTDGAVGQGNKKRNELASVRKNEFIQEMESLGIDNYSYLSIHDGTLLSCPECLDDFDISVFDYVFVTSNFDGHSDHTGAFNCVKRAVSRIKGVRVPKVFLYEVHKQLLCPSHYIDITDIVEEKKKLIKIHDSQVSILPYDEMAIMNGKCRAMQYRVPGRCFEVFQEVVGFDNENNDLTTELETKLQKQIQFYQLFVRWMRAKQKGKNIADVLISYGYKRVIIYGYAELGQLLFEELLGSNILVECVFDKNYMKYENNEVEICSPDSDVRNVDLVIVTAIYYYQDIKEELEVKGYKRVNSLGEIVDRM